MEFRSISIRSIILSAMIGIAGYLFVFSEVVSKPLTMTINGIYADYKRDRLTATQGRPRIIILAGSNGRYSHSCEVIERIYGISCTNMSISAALSLHWQFCRMKQFLASGDVVYMPLEYRDDTFDVDAIGDEAPFVVRFAKGDLRYYTWHQRLSALFYFDLRYLLSGLGEMALHRAGFARYSLAELDAQGDETGHTAAKAEAYRSSIEGQTVPLSSTAAIQDRYWTDLHDILHWGATHGVLIVGGLPTVPNDVKIPQEVVEALSHRFRSGGGCFLVLDNLSRYPRSAFYDTVYHLNEGAQIVHSEAVGRILAKMSQTHHC
jgi:hypothetical protein